VGISRRLEGHDRLLGGVLVHRWAASPSLYGLYPHMWGSFFSLDENIAYFVIQESALLPHAPAGAPRRPHARAVQRPRGAAYCSMHAQWQSRAPEPRHGQHSGRYPKYTHDGVYELGVCTQIGAFGVTGEWVFGQRTHCGIVAAPSGRGFLAMEEDCSCVPTFAHSILATEVCLCPPIRGVSAHLAGRVLHQSPGD
jgi:hypothetical protein